MSMQENGGGESYIEPGANNIILVYVLYLASFVLGLTGLIGLVFAYLNRGKAGAWADTHYTYQIRTFWIGLLYSIICTVLAIVGMSFLLMILVAVWVISAASRASRPRAAGRPSPIRRRGWCEEDGASPQEEMSSRPKRSAEPGPSNRCRPSFGTSLEIRRLLGPWSEPGMTSRNTRAPRSHL